MGLNFLRNYGARRLRQYQEQPPLNLPPASSSEDAADEERPAVHLDFEVAAEKWHGFGVEGEAPRSDEVPQRFIDGSHLGHTVAWLQDGEGFPIPVRLAEIGGVCIRAEGRELRRAFAVVEREVSMIIDPFPWHEVESFATALVRTGLRLLPAALPQEGETERAPSFDFERMREQTRVRAQHEMEVLEELALCQDRDIPSLVDGRLGRFQRAGVTRSNLVGVIKQHRESYLHPLGWRVLYGLEPGQRTPAFQLPSKHFPVVSWYLKLAGARGALPNWGVVRVEVPLGHYEQINGDTGYLNRVSLALLQRRCRQSSYGRGPVSLEPIVRAEESLKSLFARSSELMHRFYHLTGL